MNEDTLQATRVRAVTTDRYGPPDVLQIGDVEMGPLEADRIRIAVRASSVNPVDWYQLVGVPRILRLVFGMRRPKNPRVGSDVSGAVVDVGSATSRFTVGDEVFGGALGAFAEQADGKESSLAHKPENITFEQAGATAVAGVTALQAVIEHGEVGAGTRLLINGAAGGVGTFTVQIARALGADITAVCSARNVEMVKRLGADRVIDYNSADFVDGTKYDVMIDNAGNRSYADCKRSLVAGGKYVMVGAPKGGKLLGPVKRLATMRLGFLFASQKPVSFTAELTAPRLEQLADMMSNGDVVPEVERTFGLDDAAAAFELLGTSHARAKLVVVP